MTDPIQVNAGILITLMRIYDVLMTDLSLTNEEVFKRIYDLHTAGGLMTPLPYFNPENLL